MENKQPRDIHNYQKIFRNNKEQRMMAINMAYMGLPNKLPSAYKRQAANSNFVNL